MACLVNSINSIGNKTITALPYRNKNKHKQDFF